jgi:predicted transcriptional regulator
VNFDDQDWEVEQPSSAESRGISTAWKVAAGFLSGLLLGAALMLMLNRQTLQEATRSESGTTIERLLREAPPSAAAVPTPVPPVASDRSAWASSQPQAKLPEAAPAVARGDLAASAAAQADRSGMAALDAGRLATERKAREWASFYKKPPQCDDNPNRDLMIECANHYIRAKREFDATYGVGKRTPAP